MHKDTEKNFNLGYYPTDVGNLPHKTRGTIKMKIRLLILAFVMLLPASVSVLAQNDEIKLDPPLAKITTVSAMRARKAPQTSAEEVGRLKLGTVVNATNRSGNQDSIAGKTDYWYWVDLPNGQKGWLFGGLLRDYDPRRRTQIVREIIAARLKAEKMDFADLEDTYNLAASTIAEAKDANTRAEFELLKLLALADWAKSIPEPHDKSPYREWVRTHNAEVVKDEFAGGYALRSEVLWTLETKYHTLPIADRIAWEAANNPQPSDCESDEVCDYFVEAGNIKYLNAHPAGAHVAEALKTLADALTDQVIDVANGKGGDKYAVEQRVELKKSLQNLRVALGKVSAPEKEAVLKKLGRVK